MLSRPRNNTPYVQVGFGDMAKGIVVETREPFITQVINAITVHRSPFLTERRPSGRPCADRDGRNSRRLVAGASQR